MVIPIRFHFDPGSESMFVLLDTLAHEGDAVPQVHQRTNWLHPPLHTAS